MALLFTVCFSAPLSYGTDEKSEDLRQFKIQAEQARAEAQEAKYDLARTYHRGLGVKKDFKKAFELYEALAEQGHKRAQHTLDQIYNNPKKALRWFKKAAEQGHRGAQFQLAELYFHGMGGVERSFVKGHYWYEAAAKHGHIERIEEVQRGLGKNDLEMTKMKYDLSKNFLELVFTGGRITAPDSQERQNILKGIQRKARWGDKYAQYQLADIYYYGKGGFEIDRQKALELYEAVAKRGHRTAQAMLEKIAQEQQSERCY